MAGYYCSKCGVEFSGDLNFVTCPECQSGRDVRDYGCYYSEVYGPWDNVLYGWYARYCGTGNEFSYNRK